MYGMAGLDALRAQGVNKLLCMARDEEKLERVRQALSALPGLDVTSSWSMNLELMPAGVNKGMAVAALAQRLGIGPESVMALGDYDNDVSMLSYAGVSVAMANASERARAAARYRTLSNDEDGVAHAIQRYALAQALDCQGMEK